MICAKMWKHALPYFLACCLFLFVSLFLCVFLLVSWFVCLFVCLLFFGHTCHVSGSHQVSMSWHLTTSHHGVMSRHDVRCQLVQPGSQCCAMGCFGAYLTHVQTCDNAGPQSATQWTASAHILYTCPNLCDDICVQNAMLYILYTFPNLWQRSWSRCYAMDCFSACLTHSQTCDNVHGQGATQWTASVQAIHMPKPVMTFVFKVRHNGLLRYILHTCPKLWCNPCSKSATQWTAWVHTSHMSKAVM